MLLTEWNDQFGMRVHKGEETKVMCVPSTLFTFLYPSLEVDDINDEYLILINVSECVF